MAVKIKNNPNKTAHQISLMAPLLLFLMLSFLAILSVIFTAKFYRKMSLMTKANENLMISCDYILQKIRQHDVGSVSHVRFHGQDALCLTTPADHESSYVTYIYASNGKLRELFAKNGDIGTLPLSAGDPISDIADFTIEIYDTGYVKIHLTDSSDRTIEETIALRAEAVDSLIDTASLHAEAVETSTEADHTPSPEVLP